MIPNEAVLALNDEKDSTEAEIERMVEYDDVAVTTVARLEHALCKNITTANAVQMIKSDNGATSKSVKLKPIELKKFDGSFDKWIPFWEQFKETVHENLSLSSAAKFNYLGEALEKNAANTIAGFTPTERCYNEAISFLQEEYGNTDKIVEQHIQKLLALKSIQSARDVKGLRDLYNDVNSTMQTLSILNVPSSKYEIVVKSVLLRAIPSYLRITFYKIEKRDGIDTNGDEQLKQLLLFIRTEVEALEKPHMSENKDERRIRDATKQTAEQKRGTALGLLTGAQGVKRQCVFCKDANHDTNSCKTSSESDEIFLQTAKAIVENERTGERAFTRIIMDNGSQRTYISAKLARELELATVAYEKTCILAFGDSCENKNAQKLKRVNIVLKSQYNEKTKTISAIVVPSICADILPVPEIKQKKLQWMNTTLAENHLCNDKYVRGMNILIGQDNMWKFIGGESEKITDDLTAVNTFFGWTIQGCYGDNDKIHCILNTLQTREDTFDVAKFWEIESIGINAPREPAQVDVEIYINEITKRYVVALPWKISSEYLHDNKQMARKRLRDLTARLMRDPQKLREYHEGVEELWHSGVSERANEFNNSNSTVYYMPHMPVYRDDKSTSKMRIVFDASSCEPGLRLNPPLRRNFHVQSQWMSTAPCIQKRYMNRPPLNNQAGKRPSNFSQQVPLKQQRNFHIEAGTQEYQYYLQDQHYPQDQQDWYPTAEEYEAEIAKEEGGQSVQEYAEQNPSQDVQDHIDIHLLE
ncbi:PREDICTED: uncharacterized protein LOC108362346 [Rhagoletis zephyria]|uniref:uncharacterized protein LOC108362346 n=1 Tax=Rhagoletis zephyria TaxID=28612 RepID=UPI0008117624|nr:PREDICTED: uncharacterized protein LOC108362346 [Rhagoletis zephyria]